MESGHEPLTKHLYRKDEVQCCFQHAILKKNLREAVFWGIELYDSNYELDALHTLGLLWLNQIGVGCLSAWNMLVDTLRSGELERDHWIRIILSWCRISSLDCTPMALAIRGRLTPTDWKPCFPHKYELETPLDAIQNTLMRGKLLIAWLLSRAIDPQEQWATLEEVAVLRSRHAFLESLRSGCSFGEDMQKRALAFTMVSLSDEQWSMATKPLPLIEIPSEIKTLINEWDAEENIRKRRVYAIRGEALLFLANRSTLATSISTESDIQTGLHRELWKSPYWHDILQEYRANGLTESESLDMPDRMKEAFFDTYFNWKTCDIPDEWTTAEREKSHGRGCGKTSEGALRQYMATLFRTCKSQLWKHTISIDQIQNWDLEAEYSKLLEPCRSALLDHFPMKPCTIKYEIS